MRTVYTNQAGEQLVVVTDEQLADAVGLSNAMRKADFHEIDLTTYRTERDALYSDDVSDLSDDETAAVNALYNDPDIEVGSEGIGGFYAGQAEATIRTLRKAGFRVTRG